MTAEAKFSSFLPLNSATMFSCCTVTFWTLSPSIHAFSTAVFHSWVADLATFKGNYFSANKRKYVCLKSIFANWGHIKMPQTVWLSFLFIASYTIMQIYVVSINFQRLQSVKIWWKKLLKKHMTYRCKKKKKKQQTSQWRGNKATNMLRDVCL